VAVLGGGRRPTPARPAALGNGCRTSRSSSAAAAAYESAAAAAADQPQDRVSLPGAAVVGGGRRLTSACLMTIGDDQKVTSGHRPG